MADPRPAIQTLAQYSDIFDGWYPGEARSSRVPAICSKLGLSFSLSLSSFASHFFFLFSFSVLAKQFLDPLLCVRFRWVDSFFNLLLEGLIRHE
jgi:hypothetical protein